MYSKACPKQSRNAYALIKVTGMLLLWGVVGTGCEEKKLVPPPPALTVPGESLGAAIPDTIPLPDSILGALLTPVPRKDLFPLPRVPFVEKERTANIFSILRSIDILRRELVKPKPPSMTELRRYLHYTTKLQRRATPLPLERLSVQPKRITLSKPVLLKEAVFPTVIYGAESGFSLGSPVEKVVEDPFGRIWGFSDVALFSWGGAHLEVFTADEGLPTQSVIDGLWDVSGRLWFCGVQGWLRGMANSFSSCPFRATSKKS